MGRFNKDKRDYYYRRAKELGFRARSAFKLLQIDDEHGILAGATRVVDLCAAPGSWSQVLSRKLFPIVGTVSGVETLPSGGGGAEEAVIVAVDLQEMAPIPGVTQLQGDITAASTSAAIIAHFHGGRADVVICDGAPDVTGFHELDEVGQQQLLASAVSIAFHVLAHGGTFLAKMFTGPCTDLLTAQLSPWFASVIITKPRSSREASHEAFVLARGYTPPHAFTPTMALPPIANGHVVTYDGAGVGGGSNAVLVPWLAVGDLSGCDGVATAGEGSTGAGATGLPAQHERCAADQ